jgi:pimeloyl-ACP methyl ester carboxylesterase
MTLLACGGRHRGDREVARMADAIFEEPDPDRRIELVGRAFFAPGNDASVWADGWDKAVADAQLEAIAATPRDLWVDTVVDPTLVVQGLDDALAPPVNGQEYAAAHPEVELVDLPGAGHALLPERPAEVARAVVDFLERVERRRGRGSGASGGH